MKIGDKVILHKVQFPNTGSNVNMTDDFLVIEITETRKVPGHYTAEAKFDGYKAIDNNGKEWKLWWDAYPDDATCPSMRWFCEELQATMYDVGQVNLTCQIDTRPKWLDPRWFRDVMGYCEKHKCLYYFRNGGCFDCMIDKPEVPAKRTMAKGW